VAGLTGGGMVSATTRPILGRRGWGSLLQRHVALASGLLAWSEVAAT
jgi:hypothetical protein